MTGLLLPSQSGQCDLIEAVGWGVGPQKGGSCGKMPDLDFTVTTREKRGCKDGGPGRRRCRDKPSQFSLVSSKNTERSPFTVRLMRVPGGVDRQSLETQSELCHFQRLNISVLREPSGSCGPCLKLKELLPRTSLAGGWPASGHLIQGCVII